MKGRKFLAFAIAALVVVGIVGGVAYNLGASYGCNYCYPIGHEHGVDYGRALGENEAFEKLFSEGMVEDAPGLALFLEAWRILKENYIGELPPAQELAWAAIGGMVDSLDDKHTRFFSAEERLEFWESHAPLAEQSLVSSRSFGRIGYMRLRHFGHYSINAFPFYDEFRQHLEVLLSQGAEALVLDLRGNTGGNAFATMLVADELFPEGAAITRIVMKGIDGIITTQRGRLTSDQFPSDVEFLLTGGLAPEVPLVVLVNGETKSAAEMLAAAIQDHGRGVLIGETTFGKGFGKIWCELSDGSGLYIKNHYWETPSGRSITGVGITPDILVPMPEEPNGTDPQLEKAIECALALLEGRECR